MWQIRHTSARDKQEHKDEACLIPYSLYDPMPFSVPPSFRVESPAPLLINSQVKPYRCVTQLEKHMLHSSKDCMNDTWISILRGSRFKKKKKSGAAFQLNTAGYFLCVPHGFNEAIPTSLTKEPSPHLQGVTSQIFLYNILHCVH